MKYNFHVDMSGRIYEERTIGIAVVGAETNIHYGCALKGNLIKFVKKNLFGKNFFEDSAKLYAICIYILIRDIRNQIKSLIICNDEDYKTVKLMLIKLLRQIDFEIINIGDFRKDLNRNVGSFADNYANIYRKKALKPKRWSKGKELNVISINFNLIKQYWEELKK